LQTIKTKAIRVRSFILIINRLFPLGVICWGTLQTQCSSRTKAMRLNVLLRLITN